MREEGSEVRSGVGRLIVWNKGTDDETGSSVSLRKNMWNACLKSGGGVILGV